jgi:hypothetical protein
MALLPCNRPKTDHDFVAGELEVHTNTELTKLVQQFTTEIHAPLVLAADGTPATSADPYPALGADDKADS